MTTRIKSFRNDFLEKLEEEINAFLVAQEKAQNANSVLITVHYAIWYGQHSALLVYQFDPTAPANIPIP